MTRMPRVENFLMCFPLRSGTLFIASVPVVVYTLHLLTLSFIYDTIMIGSRMRSNFVEREHFYDPSTPFSYSSGITLGVGLAVITVNVLLIIGVLYKKPGLFMPWLGLCGLKLVLGALMLIIVPIMFPIILPAMPALTAGLFFLVLILLGITLHVFLVVYTYYQQVLEHKDTGRDMLLQDQGNGPYSEMA